MLKRFVLWMYFCVETFMNPRRLSEKKIPNLQQIIELTDFFFYARFFIRKSPLFPPHFNHI